MCFKNKKPFSASKNALFLNCFTLLVLNAVYFECNLYPKHIIEIESSASVFSVLMNSVFFFLQFSFLYIALNRNTHFLSNDFYLIFEPTAKKAGFLQALKLLAVICGFDAVRLVAEHLLPKFSFFISDILILLSWVCVYLLFTKPNENIFKKSGFCIAFLVIAVCLLIPSLFADLLLTKNEALLSLKYESGSLSIQSGINNLNFAFEFKAFVLDTVIGIVLLILHSRRQNSVDVQNKASTSSRSSVFFKMIALLFMAAFLCVLEWIVSPCNNINKLELRNSSHERYEFDNTFYAETNIFSVSRLKDRKTGESVFELTKNRILHNGDSVLVYYSGDSQTAHRTETSDIPNMIVLKGNFDEYTVNETPVQLYKGEAICFVENGKPKAIKPKDINGNTQSALLAEVCKTVLSDGRADFFEYCDYYLERCDAEFIASYAKRYLNADFTENELSQLKNREIRPDYITSLAKSFLSD